MGVFYKYKKLVFTFFIIVSFSGFSQTTISGKVFEDINYGGGVGRSYNDANTSASALSGFSSGDIGTGTATVQLWNSNGTSLISSQPTNTLGNYSFTVSTNTTYRIRVVNTTVKSKRPLLGSATHTELGVQTFRVESTNGNGTLVNITNEVGGRFPQNADSALGSFTGAQTWSTVAVGNSSIANINFGFNFSTIVNANASGQGSLYQFILNSNKLDNGANNLAQDFAGSVAGNETSIFMIPTPTDPLGRTADTNYQTSGNNINGLLITLNASLDDLEITDNNTSLDATTQTTNIGDTNTGELGTGGTVGTDLITFNRFQRKEIIINLNTRGVEIQAQDVKIKGLHLYNGGGLDSQTTGNLESAIWIKKETLDARAIIEDNILGYLGDGTTPNATILNNQKTAIRVQSKSTIQRNLFGNYTRYDVIVASPGNTNVGAGSIIRANESSYKTNPTEVFVDVYAIYDPDVLVEENLLKNFNQGNKTFGVNGGAGIELYLSATNVIIRNNTLDGMPVSGIYVASNSNNAIIQKNIIKNGTGVSNVANSGIGVLGSMNGGSSNNTLISQNSIYNNKTLGIDLAASQGVFGLVSKNDNGDTDGGANGQINFPILAEATLNGNNITIKGFAKPGATIEFFIADTDPFNGAANAGDNTFSGSTRDYGEGQIYLGALVEGSSADVDNTTGSYNIDGNTETNINKFEVTVDITTMPLPPGVTIQKMTTLTVTGTLNLNTSEFSPTIDVINPNDYDCDGIDNAVDLDDDNDGIPDSIEGTGDFDGDGIPNNLDLDSDGDGILDVIESGLPNVNTLDTNNDGMIDLTGNSFGNNGLLDTIETNDSPTATITYSVTNTEGDANFDFLDLDSDNDGITDLIEAQNSGTFIAPSGNDINNNGIDDIYESNPITPINTDNNGKPNYQDIDSDDDGIPDNVEAQTTAGYLAPLGTDSDNDGLDDRYDNANNTGISPVATSNAPDYINTDADADGIPDIQENGMANAISGTDTDGDGLDDAFEGANLNDGFDVNDEINDPVNDLPNTNGTGDVDYRDNGISLGPYGDGALWLRADIGIVGTFPISQWQDQSGLSRDFSTASGFPTTNSQLNFNSTVSFFNSSPAYFQYTGNLNPRSMFIVYNDTATQTQTSPFTNDTGIGDGHTDDTRVYGSSVPFNVSNAPSFVNGEFASLISRPRPDNFEIQSRLFTANVSTTSENYYLGKDNTLSNSSFGGITGNIAEVILYSDAIIPKERQVVESYLAIKYGFTLNATDNDNTIIEGDYILSDETTKVWDYTANSTYHNNVAGIGKDDGWNLFQKQSKSNNTNALVTIGLTDIKVNNPSNTSTSTNKSYLVWGHNNGALTTTTSAVPNVPAQAQCVTNERLNRIWKIVETGTVGIVEIAFSKALVDSYFSTTNSQKVVLIADDASFTTNVVEVALNTEAVVNTQQYRGTVDFNGTKYFTIADHKEIEWLGATSNWRRGSGVNGSPNTDDTGRLLIIDAQSTTNHATLVDNVNVKCAYVKANSKLMVPTNRFLEIADDLVLNGEIRLIGDGQLVQTHSGASKVHGTGKLFKDQQAKVPNVYRYHYWSSPVTEIGATTFRVGEVMKDGTIPTSETSNPLDINWQGGNNYDGAPGDYTTTPNNPTPITISSYWIYTNQNDPGDGSAWTQRRETGIINKGQGFTMKSTGATPQNFTFVGTPIDGDITFNINAAPFSSVYGNPYPSALDISEFINDNLSSIDGTLYFWEHTGEDTSSTTTNEGHYQRNYQGGYSQRNLAMGIAANSPAISGNSTSTFDWENATGSGTTVTEQQTITVDNTNYVFNATVSIDDAFGVFLIDKMGASGTSGNVIAKNAGLSTATLKVEFDKAVDISSIYLYNDVQNNNTNTITITANNPNRNSSVLQTLTGNSGQSIALNWTDVHSFTISSQNPNNIVLDDIGFARGNAISLGQGTYNEPTNFMAVAQGFTVNGSNTGGQVVFKNSQRVYKDDNYNNGGTFFFKGSNQKENKNSINETLPILKLGLDSKENNINFHRQIGISFKQGNTFAYDNGYDSEIFDIGATDMYWNFNEVPDKNLIIAGVEPISESLRVPMLININTKQNITIGIDEIKNITITIYLEDRLTGVFYNLSEKVDLNLEKGNYNDRFFLAFNNVTLNVDSEVFKENTILIYADNLLEEIIIKNPKRILINDIELYSILGKKIAKWENVDSIEENRFKYENLSNGFYIAKVNTEKGFFSKKILLKN